MLLRYHAGERRVWSVARVPTVEEEDERRAHRELERLRQERTAHSNRIGSLLVLHNLRVKHMGGRNWQRWWESHAAQLPAGMRVRTISGAPKTTGARHATVWGKRLASGTKQVGSVRCR
jgi:hypothetical protein